MIYFPDQMITEDLIVVLSITETYTLHADQFHPFNHAFPSFLEFNFCFIVKEQVQWKQGDMERVL